ncbi:MAG TPA: DUF6519 domain-containing protein [Candidatus Thiothrix moscowensis]|uniref:DUF6519 domain-containing protein n=1 Tax=Thiothrix sp. UBA2016 TaxID=1947695 RepID=UPI0025D93DFF|nr:DUF6519 domain-containing protein [Thiothrix sp. UBA2016]HRJ53128.1 DUF6519 domain-containing protein [Candidatus Thiothrix moscowensis]HRJ93119.1 DUF6519 domain-containing protein [Candidatus Thiothrix moscowensis]
MKGDFSRDTFNPLKHFSRVLMQQGRVQLDADWNEQTSILLHYLQTLAKDLIGPYGGPTDAYGFQIGDKVDSTDGQQPKIMATDNFSIGFGRYYVDGVLCENLMQSGENKNITYTKQQDYPFPPETENSKELYLQAGNHYLVYLDVWERHITAIEDDSIREVALGGIDTANRAKIVWQVKVFEVKSLDDEPWNGILTNVNNESLVDQTKLQEFMKKEILKERGKLNVKVDNITTGGVACDASPESGYQGLSNQLYRIEIHKKGKADTATFKWSRENASIVTTITAYADKVISVKSSSGFFIGDLVEITNDEKELRGEPGVLIKIANMDGNKIFLEKAVPTSEKDKLRRWDMRNEDVKITKDAWIKLDQGIQLRFDISDSIEYCSGDYWLIPARSETGGIEWPNDGKGDPLAIPPHGIKHHYAPLAILKYSTSEKKWEVTDCRCSFTQLSCLPQG